MTWAQEQIDTAVRACRITVPAGRRIQLFGGTHSNLIARVGEFVGLDVYGLVDLPRNPSKTSWTNSDEQNVLNIANWTKLYDSAFALRPIPAQVTVKATCTCDMVSLLNAGCPSARGKPCRALR